MHLKPQDRPQTLNIVFQSYHIMIAIGVLLIALTTFGFILLKKNKLFQKRWLMLVFAWECVAPQIANQVGW
jgi:cytochrome d ubiquinol oxidase subunit I